MKSRDERPRSPRRDEAKAGTRRRVLAAAMEVFAREGYHAARMDAIAEAAGVSKGALYFHFPGKLPLFSALVDEFAAELGADVTVAIAAHQGGVARVEAAVTAALEPLRTPARPRPHRAHRGGEPRARLRDEAPRDPRPLRRAGAAPSRRGRRRGKHPAARHRVAAYAWLGALNEVAMQSLEGELSAPEDAARALSALLLRSVGVVETGAMSDR